MKRALLTALVVTLTAACESDAGVELPEIEEARRNAARNACAAAELTTRARTNLETLSALADAGGIGPAHAIVDFARIYAQHAELREAAITRVDSAVNHARTTTDSLRYVEAANRFVPGRPEPETVEANVFTAYARDFQEIRANEDHRCNWAI